MLSSLKTTKYLKLPCRWNIIPCYCRHLNIAASEVENSTRYSDVKTTTVLPKKARVVICGAGIMGGAVAYHLAKSGWGPDTVIVEQAT